jgi:hypothetical protein
VLFYKARDASDLVRSDSQKLLNSRDFSWAAAASGAWRGTAKALCLQPQTYLKHNGKRYTIVNQTGGEANHHAVIWLPDGLAGKMTL